jgi:autotransporter-associated beta strand protein
MKPKNHSLLRASRLAFVTISLGTLPAFAGTIWDGVKNDLSPAADSNINNPENWDADTLPDLAGPSTVTFGTASGTATINTPVEFVRTTISNSFTLADGAGSLTYRGTNSGGNAYGIQATSNAANVQIDEPILVEAVATAAPLGNLFLIYNNRLTADTTNLSINGGIALAPSSTAATYNLRYGNNTSGNASTSNTRIAGTISGMGTLQNSSANGPWAGDLIIAGDQASLTTTDITISSSGSGFQSPTTTARLVLGETSADDQTWRNITLNNVMKLAIGGTINASAFSGNITGTSITGYGAGGTLSFNSGEIGANVVLGGAGTDENNLSLTKKGSGNLIIRSSSATYTGPTIVEAGTLSVASTATLASPITVQAGATLSSEGGTTSSLTFGSGTSNLNFDPATPGSFTADSVNTGGATIVANPTAATTVNQTYTVLTRGSGTFSVSDVAAFIGGGRSTIGGVGTNTITYTADAAAALTWKGNDGTNPTFWDIGTTFNWDNAGSDRFFSNDAVTFDDTASSYAIAIQGSSVSPGNMVFNHSTNNYTISGGTIGGSGSLTKSGSGTLTLAQASGVNSFSGALQINGGTLSISSLNRIGGSASTRAIELGGGTLEYTYSAGNAEVSDVLPLVLNPGNSTLSVTGSYVTGSVNAPTAPVTLRLGSALTGSGNLTKSGSGILAIGKNSDTTLGNTFDGTVTVNDGALDIRNPDSLGDTSAGTTITNAQLELFSFGQNAGVTFDAEPLTFTGNSYFRSKNEDMDSDILHVWTGPVDVASGAVVGIAAAKAVTTNPAVANTLTAISPNITSLEIAAPVTTAAGSTLKLGLINPSSTLPVIQETVAQRVTLSDTLSGSAAVETQGAAASVFTLVDPEYSGDTTVNSGTLSLGADNPNNSASTVTIAATNATLDLDFGDTDTVSKLFIGGVQKPAGVYEAVGNPGTGTEIAQITGSGTLNVTSGPAGYSSWQTANGAGTQTVDQDHDNDGVDNGVEYFLGGNTITTGFTPLPVPVSGAVTWVKAASYTGTFDIDFKVQSSPNLTTWTDATSSGTPGLPGTVHLSGSNVTYTLPTGTGKTFVRLLVKPN